jgi:hypothetical protein
MGTIQSERGNKTALMWFITDRSGDGLQPQTETQPEGSSSELRGEEMTMECGICEHEGDLRDAPPFLCFNCCDAIRRLVWISEHEQVRAEFCEPVQNAERTGARIPKSAVLGRR